MANQPSRAVAFVDEAFIRAPNHPGAYLFAAVLVNANDLATTVDAAALAAGPHAAYHSTRLYHRGHIQPIEDMLDVIRAHTEWTILAAHAPLGDDQETARQSALARLLQNLNSQKIRDVVLDTRASAREQLHTQLEGRKVARSDLPDITTYRNLVRDGTVSHRMRLLHIDDTRQPGLWMADAAAWSFQRALVYDEPQWWSRITDTATIIEARTGRTLALESNRVAPPDGERDPRNLSQRAQEPLLHRRSYTLNGGGTNCSLGPGQLYTNLLDQIASAQSTGPAESLRVQIGQLTRTVEHLAQAVQLSPPVRQMDPADHRFRGELGPHHGEPAMDIEPDTS